MLLALHSRLEQMAHKVRGRGAGRGRRRPPLTFLLLVLVFGATLALLGGLVMLGGLVLGAALALHRGGAAVVVTARVIHAKPMITGRAGSKNLWPPAGLSVLLPAADGAVDWALEGGTMGGAELRG